MKTKVKTNIRKIKMVGEPSGLPYKLLNKSWRILSKLKGKLITTIIWPSITFITKIC